MDPIQQLNEYLNATGRGTFDFFGPDANCTLALCSPDWSVYGYRPALGANLAFLVLFFLALAAHIAVGLKYRSSSLSSSWSFVACMAAGCLDEMLGYAGRVWMFYDLWNFNAFMIQVVCITTAPVFYCAAIYVVLAKTITVFAPDLSRCRNTSLFYWIFIPFDLLSLILQGAGGALSALSSGLSHRGVNIALAGLSLQVVTLLVFCALYIDFLWRYYHRRSSTVTVPPKDARSMKLFYGFEMLAVVAILARCAFRVHELSDGYSGPLVGREDLFIGLEGVPIVVAAFALCIGHPGLIFGSSSQQFNDPSQQRKESVAATSVESGHREV